MLEYLAIQGLSLRDGLGSVPPGEAIDIERLWATEEVTLLSGKRREYAAESPAGFLVTVAPDEGIAFSLDIKRAVEAAYWARQPITIEETLSDPGTLRTWTGLLAEKPTFREVPGSERQFYRFALKIFQEEP